jgi:hypothetical protein
MRSIRPAADCTGLVMTTTQRINIQKVARTADDGAAFANACSAAKQVKYE